MKTLIRALILILVGFVSQASAAIRPSFGLEHCAWHATHIVVATEGMRIDGRLTVLESWKGDLSAGEVISIPDLATFKSRPSRAIKVMFDRPTNGPLKYVSGKRMILFLKKETRSADKIDQIRYDAEHPSVWSPADKAGFNVSVVWIEGEQTFAFQQLMNPGPSLLTYYEKPESELRARALDVIRVQDSLNETLMTTDCPKKAEALEQFATSSFYYAKNEAFAELEKCGEAALPVLRKMLNDQSLLRVHTKTIELMAVIGGEQVGDDITQIVREELEFWKNTAPSLKEGWWSETNEPQTETLRDRYSRLYIALYSIRKLRIIGCKDIVTELRDFWRSLSQLEDKTGLNQVSQECDKILSSLE